MKYYNLFLGLTLISFGFIDIASKDYVWGGGCFFFGIGNIILAYKSFVKKTT